MPAPKILPIKRMEDLQTGLVGRCEQGQFMIVDTLSPPNRSNSLRQSSKLYVVRYRFNSSGELLDTRYVTLPHSASETVLNDHKGRLLQELEPVSLVDISVKPFECTIDGITFGLVYSEETGA